MLIELEEAMHTHILTFLAAQNGVYADGSTRLIMSLIDDEETHYKAIQDCRAKEGSDPIVAVPFAILYRSEHESRIRSGSSSQKRGEVTLNQPSAPAGDARIAHFRHFTLRYTLIIYSNLYTEVTNVFEYWLLNAGRSHTAFSFTFPEADDSVLDANIAFEEPQIVTPTYDRTEEWGVVYRQEFDIILSSIVMSAAEDAFAILTPISNIHVLNADEEFPD